MSVSSDHKLSRRRFVIAGGALLGVVTAGASGVGYLLHRVNRIGDREGLLSPSRITDPQSALFRAYPGLRDHIPFRSLATLPTPVEKLDIINGTATGRLWVKRDDLTSPHYGGNKIRKLEHLLEHALQQGCNSLITIGGLGSNHCLATAIHGARLGIKVHLSLFDQPVTSFVRQNLAGYLAAGAEIHYCATLKKAYGFSRGLLKQLKKKKENPYFILSGGTCGLSNVGHVNAAFEIREQIERGDLPEPDRLFVAAGTCGTMSGLIAGLKLADLSTRVVGVRVVDGFPAYPRVIRYYAQSVADQLRKFEPSMAKVHIGMSDFELMTGYLGDGYGVVTAEAVEAVRQASPAITLETTYTGKTLAACIDYCRKGSSAENILFWNSFNSSPFEQSTTPGALPESIIRKLES